jgi:hypothetical protein
MKQLSLITCLALAMTNSYSQEGRLPRGKTLNIVMVDSIQSRSSGYLAAIGDSGIICLRSPVSFNQRFLNENHNIVPYWNLSKVFIQKKGSVVRGMWIGGLSGMAVFGLAAAVSSARSEIGVDVPVVLSVGALYGTIVGGFIGVLSRKKFIIGRNKEKFDEMKKTILDMTYKY